MFRPPVPKYTGENPYTVLGVPKTASASDIRTAYRKKALKLHPDRNPGDKKAEAEFKKLTAAYEVIGDETKRSEFDNPAPSPSMMFSGWGGGGRPHRRRKPTKTPDINHGMCVTLMDMFNGCERKMRLSKRVLCGECKATGAKDSSDQHEKTCGQCRGAGAVMTQVQIGPGMIQQSQKTCGACKGTGKTIPPEMRCGTCSGSRVVKSTSDLVVVIEKGSVVGHKVVLFGEAEQSPGVQTGDVVINLVGSPPQAEQEAQDKHFKAHTSKNKYDKKKTATTPEFVVIKRVTPTGPDLWFEKTVTLQQALFGFKVHFLHLDGRLVTVQVPRGRVLQPHEVLRVKGEGISHFKSIDKIGDLYIKTKIVMPLFNQIKHLEQKLENKSGKDAQQVDDNDADDHNNNVTVVADICPVSDLLAKQKTSINGKQQHDQSHHQQQQRPPQQQCRQM